MASIPSRYKLNWLSAEQVAEKLNLSKNTVYILVRSGDIPCRKIGKGGKRPSAVLIHRVELEEYINTLAENEVE